jgi:hypothetical protein
MNLAERITLEEGLKMYAINPQKHVRNDDRKRLLREASVADLAVFERNLFDVEMEHLQDCRVMATVVDGTVLNRLCFLRSVLQVRKLQKIDSAELSCNGEISFDDHRGMLLHFVSEFSES